MADGDLQRHIRRCHAAYARAARAAARALRRRPRAVVRAGAHGRRLPHGRARAPAAGHGHAASTSRAASTSASIRWRRFYRSHAAARRPAAGLRRDRGGRTSIRRWIACATCWSRWASVSRQPRHAGSPPASCRARAAAALSSAPSRSPRNCTADFITCCTTGAIARSVLRSACGAWRTRIASTRSRTLRRTPATNGDGGPGRSIERRERRMVGAELDEADGQRMPQLGRGQRGRALGQRRPAAATARRPARASARRPRPPWCGRTGTASRWTTPTARRSRSSSRRRSPWRRTPRRRRRAAPPRAAGRARGAARAARRRRRRRRSGTNPLEREGRWTFMSLSS